MNNGILIIAHAPLASALRHCVAHVFADVHAVAAIDVQPHVPPEESLAVARQALALLGCVQTLVLTDLFGATPCNVAQKLVDGPHIRVVAGVNLSMLLRVVNYRHESLDVLMARAIAGGTQGVMHVAVTAPHNQVDKNNDQDQHAHQQ